MGIEVTDSHNVTVPGGTIVTIKDALQIVQGGKMVGTLDAQYDFKDLAPEYHQTALQIISKRTRLGMPTWEDMEISRRQGERYKERKAEYEKLSWWERLFAKRPWAYDDENDVPKED